MNAARQIGAFLTLKSRGAERGEGDQGKIPTQLAAAGAETPVKDGMIIGKHANLTIFNPAAGVVAVTAVEVVAVTALAAATMIEAKLEIAGATVPVGAPGASTVTGVGGVCQILMLQGVALLTNATTAVQGDVLIGAHIAKGVSAFATTGFQGVVATGGQNHTPIVPNPGETTVLGVAQTDATFA